MHVRTIVVYTALFLAACKPHRAPDPVITDDDLVLEVSNNNWSDVVIYMVHDGRRTRFTTVTAAHSTSVVLPARYVGANGVIQIIAHRIGGNDEYVSPVVSVRMGHTIALTLESNLGRSSLGVW